MGDDRGKKSLKEIGDDYWIALQDFNNATDKNIDKAIENLNKAEAAYLLAIKED